MNWEQVLKNIGAMTGLLVITIVWLGQALWMRVEADKRGMQGWLWAFIGVLTPPFGLFFFLFWRMRYPVLPEVAERDEVIEETSRTKVPFYEIMKERAGPPTAGEQEQGTGSDKEPPPTPPENSIQAALEAEERRFRERNP